MKNIKRYYQAWELRQQGKTLNEIGVVMGFSRERARTMTKYIDTKIEIQKGRLPKELKELIKRYEKTSDP